MKRFQLWLTLTVLMMLFGVRVDAHDIAVENDDGVTIYYVWTNDQTELAVSYRGNRISSSERNRKDYKDEVVIPASVLYNNEKYNVTSISSYAFYRCTGLKSITIPNSVTKIDSYAFSGCTGLPCITIPNSINSIDDYAFSGCTGLTSITIPNSVNSIDDYAFSGCTGLTSITIPNSITSIGYKPFNGCKNLASADVRCSVNTDHLFDGCEGLISLYANCRSIGGWLKYIQSLKTLEIGDVVDTIVNNAFCGSGNVGGNLIFLTCKSLEEIKVSSNNLNFMSVNGVLYNKAMDSLVCYPFNKPDETWSTPTTLRTMTSDFCNVTSPLKEIAFNGAMDYFFTPGANDERTEKLKISFSQLPASSTNPPANTGIKTCDYYIPKGSWIAYKKLISTDRRDNKTLVYELDGNEIC